MIRGISRGRLLLVGGAAVLLVVGGLIGAVIALAADGGGGSPVAAASASPSPTLAADDPAVPLARQDGQLTAAALYASTLSEAATGCRASRQWTAERVSQVLTVARSTTAWALIVGLRDKTPGEDCSRLTTSWILGFQVPPRSSPIVG